MRDPATKSVEEIFLELVDLPRADRALQLAHREGGMGAVYDTIHQPTSRRAAVKLIRAGVATASGRERMRIEAETLARLNDPGIAQLYDAGIAEVTWPDGSHSRRPFIAMEFVPDAVSITHFARSANLSVLERITLIERVARAVHHAHQRGVIHRDLKPGNVLISQSTGTPKIVDFGIARLTDANVTAVTATGQVVGTVRYMSPEQAGGDPKALDTRTDIYSLGAILYELLAGRPVIEAESGSSIGAIMQLLNVVPRQLASINPELKGDIDAIVHKSIERSPDDRYASAAAFADDLGRFLDGREVSARAPTTVERFVRIVKRNKAKFAVAAVIAISLVGGIIGTSWGLVRAERARRDVVRQKAEADRRREEAEAVNSFLTDDLLSKAGPDNLPDKAVRDVIIQKLIDPAAAAVATRFEEKPLIEAAVRDSLALTYQTSGREDLGLPQAITSLEIRRRLLGDDHPNTLTSMNTVAVLLDTQGKLEAAEPLYREALERKRRVLGDDDPSTLRSINNMGYLLMAQGKLNEAEPLYREALERRRRVLGGDHQETLISMHNLSGVLQALGKPQEAEPLLRETLECSRRLLGDDHPNTLTAINAMGYVLRVQGKLEAAEPLWREALERRRRVLGDDHPDTLKSINNMGYLLQLQSKLEAAEPLLLEAVTRAKANRSLGPQHATTKRYAAMYANCLDSLNRPAEAAAVRKEFSLPEPAATQPTTHPATRP